MGNFFSDFFTDKSSSQTNTVASKYTPEQNDLLKKMIASLGGYAGDKKLPAYSGELTAPLTDTQSLSTEKLLSLLNPNSSLTQTRNASLQDIISGKTALPATLTENYIKNVEDPTIKNYKETVIPEIAGTFASKGLSYGSSKYNATKDASETLTDALAKGRAQLNSDITKTTLDNQIAGMNTLNSANQTTLQEILGLATFGKTEQDTQQAKLNALYQQWLRDQPGTNPAQNMLMQLLGLYPNESSSTATEGDSTKSKASFAMKEQTVLNDTMKNLCWVWTFFDGENGKQTVAARKFRDELFGKYSLVKTGYEAMGKVVRPLMSRSNVVKWLVKKCIYNPINKIASGRKDKHLLAIGYTWKFVWESIAKVKNYFDEKAYCCYER